MKKLTLVALLAALVVTGSAFAQVIPDATISVPVSDPVTVISLKRIEAQLTLDAPYARITLGYYRQSGSLDREDVVVVTDGDTGSVTDDLLTGRGPAAGEPIGILAAMGIAVDGESQSSVALAVRKRVMTWIGVNFPTLLTGATVN